jgi:thiaminase
MSFCAEQLARLQTDWDRMRHHPFLLHTRDGTIPFDTFATWMRQDYLFVEAAIPFISALLARAPRRHWETHAGVISMLQRELELFRDRATAAGVDMTELRPSFVNHAYIQFLIATGYRESYEGAFTVLYAAEKAYHDSWTVVRRGIDPGSVWYPFVENWAGDAFAGYVAYLEAECDALAGAAGPGERARMAELFELAMRYEIAFWDMAATGEGWPAGVDALPSPAAGVMPDAAARRLPPEEAP